MTTRFYRRATGRRGGARSSRRSGTRSCGEDSEDESDAEERRRASFVDDASRMARRTYERLRRRMHRVRRREVLSTPGGGADGADDGSSRGRGAPRRQRSFSVDAAVDSYVVADPAVVASTVPLLALAVHRSTWGVFAAAAVVALAAADVARGPVGCLDVAILAASVGALGVQCDVVRCVTQRLVDSVESVSGAGPRRRDVDVDVDGCGRGRATRTREPPRRSRDGARADERRRLVSVPSSDDGARASTWSRPSGQRKGANVSPFEGSLCISLEALRI